MKKIFIALLALIPFLNSSGQSAGNDTTQYIYYRFTYGNALDRYWAKKVLLIPADTTYSKDGLAIKSGTLYVGNGIKWSQVTGGGGGGGTDSSDAVGYGLLKAIAGTTRTYTVDTFAVTSRASRQKLADSLALLINKKINIADSAGAGYATFNRLKKVADSLGLLIGGGGVSPGAPTATIGYNAVNGSSPNYMRSDAAPKIDTSASTGVAPRHIVADTAAALRAALTGTDTTIFRATGSAVRPPFYLSQVGGINTVSFPKPRDSLDYHSVLAPDSAAVSYVNAHDSSTMQSKAQTDTMRAHIYAALAVAGGLAYPNTIKKYLNGYGNFASLNTDSITEGSINQYFTQARARGSVSGAAPITYNSGTGVIGADTSHTTTSLATFTNTRDTAAAIRYAQRWPAPTVFGQIYNKNYWRNGLNDFQNNSGSGLTVTASNGFVTVVPNSINWGNSLDIDPLYFTMLNRWSFTSTIVVKAVTTGSTGFGPEIRSVQTANVKNGLQCYVVGTSSGAGSLQLVAEGGSPTLASHSGHQLHVGDSLDFTLTLRDTAVVFICKNYTTGFTDSVNYSFVIGTRTPPTSGSFGWIGHGDGTGSYQIQAARITSDFIKNPNICVIGNSKQQGFKADNWHGRYADSLGRLYGYTVLYAESNGRVEDEVNRLQEIMAINAHVYIHDAPCNDLRNNYHTIQRTFTDYKTIRDALAVGGARVLHMTWPEDTTGSSSPNAVRLKPWNDLMKSTWPNDVIPAYDSMSTSDNLNAAYQIAADKVHVNQAGDNAAIRATVVTGFLSTLNSNLLVYSRTGVADVNQNGDSISFLPVDKKLNYIRHDIAGGGQSNGVIQDNGTQAGVSPTIFSPMTGVDFTANGVIGVSPRIVGSPFGFAMADQNTPLDQTYLNYGQNRRYNIFSSHGGKVIGQGDSVGRWAFGGDIGSGPSAYVTLNKGKAAVGNAPLKFSLSNSILVSIPEKGAEEADSVGNRFHTDSSGTRHQYANLDANVFTSTQNFTGATTTVVTASALDSTTKAASTAYVDEAVRSFWIRVTANSGTTLLPATDVRRILFDPATAGTMTVQFVALKDGQEIELYFGGTIASGSSVFSSLTVSYSGGGIVDDSAPTSATSGQFCLRYVYNKALDKFYRKKN